MSAHGRHLWNVGATRRYRRLIASWEPTRAALLRRQRRVLGLADDLIAATEETREIPRYQRSVSLPEIRGRAA